MPEASNLKRYAGVRLHRRGVAERCAAPFPPLPPPQPTRLVERLAPEEDENDPRARSEERKRGDFAPRDQDSHNERHGRLWNED